MHEQSIKLPLTPTLESPTYEIRVRFLVFIPQAQPCSFSFFEDQLDKSDLITAFPLNTAKHVNALLFLFWLEHTAHILKSINMKGRH